MMGNATTLTIYRPSDSDGRSPLNLATRAIWLPRLGPTAWVILQELHTRSQAMPYELELASLAALVGVKPSVARAALVRLARFRVIFFEPTYGAVVSDGSLPR